MKLAVSHKGCPTGRRQLQVISNNGDPVNLALLSDRIRQAVEAIAYDA
jgi:hypothetical protein